MNKPKLGRTPKKESLSYFRCTNGKFVKGVKEEIPGVTVSREITKGDHAGKIVHEIQEDGFVGELLELKVERKKAGGGKEKDFLIMKLDISNDDEPEESVQIETFIDSNYAFSFLDRLPHLTHFPCYVELTPYDFTKDKKRSVGISVKVWDGSDFVKCAAYWTKEKPGKRPPWKKMELNGDTVYDKSKTIAFYKALIIKFNDKLREALESKAPKPQPEPEVEEDEAVTDQEENANIMEGEDQDYDPADDLPF